LQLCYTIWLVLTSGEHKLFSSITDFVPCWGKGRNELTDSQGAVITWKAFWAADSRYLQNGAAHLRIELSLPDS
jgi:hypothetical protein